jgi:hypothetical protein
MKGTWQTTDDGGGGSGLGLAVVIILAAALLGPAIAAAVAELLHVLVIVVGVILDLGATSLLAFVAFRVSRGRHDTARLVNRITSAPSRPSTLRSEPLRAIEQRAIHLHFHGVSPEDVAAIIDRHQENQ